MNKKTQLDILYYDIGNQYDFFLCGTYKVGEDTKFTKWKKYSECIFPLDVTGGNHWQDENFLEQINQRQILPERQAGQQLK